MKLYPAHDGATDIANAHKAQLQGKWAIVTGSTSGIGLATARALLGAGCNVVICARSVENGARVATELRSNCGSSQGQLLVEQLDLANLSVVCRFAMAIKKRLSRLDLLICNGGVMATPFGSTADGFETQLGTNYIGHFALVQELLPLMKKLVDDDSPGRIVILSSVCHKWASVDLEDLNFTHGRRYNKWVAYGQSKLACLMFARELARRLEEEGSEIIVAAVHPGVVFTGITRHTAEFSCLAPVTKFLLDPLTKSTDLGAGSILFACLSNEFPSGAYIEDCQVIQPGFRLYPGGMACDPVMTAGLYNKTLQLIQEAKDKSLKESPKVVLSTSPEIQKHANCPNPLGPALDVA